MKTTTTFALLATMLLPLLFLSGCPEMKLASQSLNKCFTPAEQWFLGAALNHITALEDKEARGETLTAQEEKHLAFLSKFVHAATIAWMEQTRESIWPEDKQPKTPANTTVRRSYTRPTVCPGIAMAQVDFFKSGGMWWGIGTANASQLTQIQAGNVTVKTSDNRVGYVNQGGTASRTPPRPMLK